MTHCQNKVNSKVSFQNFTVVNLSYSFFCRICGELEMNDVAWFYADAKDEDRLVFHCGDKTDQETMTDFYERITKSKLFNLSITVKNRCDLFNYLGEVYVGDNDTQQIGKCELFVRDRTNQIHVATVGHTLLTESQRRTLEQPNNEKHHKNLLTNIRNQLQRAENVTISCSFLNACQLVRGDYNPNRLNLSINDPAAYVDLRFLTFTNRDRYTDEVASFASDIALIHSTVSNGFVSGVEEIMSPNVVVSLMSMGDIQAMLDDLHNNKGRDYTIYAKFNRRGTIINEYMIDGSRLGYRILFELDDRLVTT